MDLINLGIIRRKRERQLLVRLQVTIRAATRGPTRAARKVTFKAVVVVLVLRRARINDWIYWNSILGGKK